ncbi:MAG: rRNA maturation RNase YbeY [Bacteroidia bacterium]
MKKSQNKKEQSQSLDNIEFNHKNTRTNFNKAKYIVWLNQVAKHYKKKINLISYCFMNDEDLLKINIEHLQHDYYTDIITFQLNNKNEDLEADIYISLDRIRDNSKHLKILYSEEMRRVIAHGLLHLIGFKDKTKNDQIKMREAENHALSLYQ